MVDFWYRKNKTKNREYELLGRIKVVDEFIILSKLHYIRDIW